MKKSKKLFLLLIVVFIVLSAIVINGRYLKKSKIDNIDKVLQSESYKYLSAPAQNYIKEVYEETGEILLTEKNKVENEYYLNPEYVNYLDLPEEEKQNVEIIPSQQVMDYVMPKAAPDNQDLPSSFDLRNVEGKNFTTPVENQGSLGLCWSFSLLSQAESYLQVKNQESYNANTQIFSKRHLDYALADNGIIDMNKQKYQINSRHLGDGSSDNAPTLPLVDGVSFTDISWRDYNVNDFERLTYKEVYNYSQSLYELNSYKFVSKLNIDELDLTQEENQEKQNAYLNYLKNAIMQYGGLKVGTKSPYGDCSLSTNDNKRLIYDDGKCKAAGHAMHVIGWDDNYEYSFCSLKDDRNYNYLEKDLTKCSSENIISGKGAWILKNSWGNIYPYLYLAYNSKDSDFSFISDMSEATWDSKYDRKELLNYISSSSNNYEYSVVLPQDEELKLNKFKFNSHKQNIVAELIVENDSGSVLYTDSINIDMPGWYTFDLSDQNINVKKDYVIKTKAFSIDKIFTNNVANNNPIIETSDVTYKPYLGTDQFYKMRIESKIKNIPEGSLIEYKVIDQNDKEITSNYSVTENEVSAEFVFAKLIVDSIAKGKYTLQSIYNNEVLDESIITVDRDHVITYGSGTKADPYLITSPAQLDLIRTNTTAFYKLENDIDLTFDTQDSHGLFYNEGSGWMPIKYNSHIGFSGGLDGKNHKIIGLYINRPKQDYVGLFEQNNNAKNIIFENAKVIGNNYVGVLAGKTTGNIDGGTGAGYCLTLENISIIGGSIEGNNYVGGISGTNITGWCVENKQLYHKVSNIYNSASVIGNDYVGGIFGQLGTFPYFKDAPGSIENLVNVGNVQSKNNAGGLTGQISLQHTNPLTITNFINSGKVSSNYGVFGTFENENSETLTINNAYYIQSSGNVSNEYITLNNSSSKTLTELKDNSLYTSWGEFGSYWTNKINESTPRIPILKHANSIYTTMNNIVLEQNKTINISDFINKPFNDINNLDFTMADENVATIDEQGNIYGKASGNSTLSVISYYDGRTLEIPITVNNPTYYEITYDLDGGTNNPENVTQYALGENVVIKAPTKEGYIFIGWTGSNGSNPEKEVTISNDQTGNLHYVANWEIANNYGDVNKDGKITRDDVNTLYKHLNNETPITDEVSLHNADANGDGVVDQKDKDAIYAYVIDHPEGELSKTPLTNKEYVAYGDANEDGFINMLDLVYVGRYDIGNKFYLTEQGKKNADVDNNGIVDVADRTYIGKYYNKWPDADTLPRKSKVFFYGDIDFDLKVGFSDILQLISTRYNNDNSYVWNEEVLKALGMESGSKPGFSEIVSLIDYVYEPHKITYDLDGGTMPDDYPKTFRASEFSLLELPTPVKEGYTFSFWAGDIWKNDAGEEVDMNSFSDFYKNPTNDLTYTAVWKAIEE